MLPDIFKASEDPALALGAAGGGLLMFFLKDFFRRSTKQSDESRKSISDLTKDVGLLEAAKERSKEKDLEYEQRIKDLEAEVRELREQFLVFRTKCE